ncbi:YoaP domain-containing protein [Bacillus chungangensis]
MVWTIFGLFYDEDLITHGMMSAKSIIKTIIIN